MKKARKLKLYPLDHKKHGVGGPVTKLPSWRKQDARAMPCELFAVVFFPKITQIGNAHLAFYQLSHTLSQSPEAAISRFMDGIRQGEKWETYKRAGHRVRRVKITDLGDCLPSTAKPSRKWL